MRVAIIGAGPAGLFTGAALAARGHEVVAVDRDTAPPPEGPWRRPGVMQFHHAHAFRTQVGRALKAEWPEALEAWLELGAEPITFDLPGRGVVPAGHRSRRDTFERALRATAPGVPHLSIRQGHVDGLLTAEGRVRGVVVDRQPLEADLVVDASGRSGRSVDELRAPSSLGGPCGIAYVDREYRLRDGAEPGPMTNALAWQGDFDGWQSLVFLHERGYFSVVVLRPTADAVLKDLRHGAAFDAVCRAVPALAAWTDPAASRRRSCRSSGCWRCSTATGTLRWWGSRSTRGARRTCGRGWPTTSRWTPTPSAGGRAATSTRPGGCPRT
jgi:2-polyprenyl-6-methoxyphenol hydroxylase-like FAD-dependent oxidoreductase